MNTNTVVVNGTPNDDILYGKLNRTVIYGNGGNDTIYGLSGLDTMHGGTGNDTFHIKGSGDTIIEGVGEGTDTVYSSVSYTAPRNVENLVLTGSARINGTGNNSDNVITGNDNYNRLNGGRGNDTIYGNGGEDTIDGGEGDDKLYGGADRDNIFGGAGNDLLDGGTGKDVMRGQTGDDVYYVDNVDDTVIEEAGEGTDTIYSSVSYTASRNVENLVLTGSTHIDGTGNDSNNVISGNNSNNRLNGGHGNDIIYGNGGNDTIYGGYGDDKLYGGDGNDSIHGDYGNDFIVGGRGNDSLQGFDGNDTYYFAKGYGHDKVYDSRGSNTVHFGGITIDDITIHEKYGDWVITLKETGDTLTLDDQTRMGGTAAFFEFSDGRYSASELWQALALKAINGRTIIGTPAADRLIGGADNDLLIGGGGDDHLDGGAGKDVMRGQAGNDVYYVDDAGDTVIEEAGQGTDTIYSSVSYTLPGNVENLVLTGSNAHIEGIGNDSDNVITGNSKYNRLKGGGGNDTIYSNGGGDSINGGEGNDKLYGGDGNDSIYGDAGNDNLYGSVGNDSIDGGYGDDFIDGGTGNDRLSDSNGNNIFYFTKGYGHDEIRFSWSGNNTVRFGGGITVNDIIVREERGGWVVTLKETGDTLTIDSQTQAGKTVAFFEFSDGRYSASELWQALNSINGQTIIGTPAADRLVGGIDNDLLIGGDGDDHLDGGVGRDVMRGQAGNDAYYVDDAEDTVIEEAGQGTDTIYSSISYTLPGNVENLVLTGDARIDGTGNDSDNVITGNSKYNRLKGGGGNDTIYSNGGGDYIEGGDGNDIIYGGSENTYSSGDYIDGGAGDDTIYGNGNRDRIYGGAGNDYIDGGTGYDLLNGGTGNDTYYFAKGYGYDVIQNTGGSNTVRFGSGITANDITLRNEGGNWVIKLKETEDTLIIENQRTDAGVAVTRFAFANSSYSPEALWQAVNGVQSEKGRTIIGTPKDDRLIGGDGNDLLIGDEGNDYFDGGAGNDRMEGSTGHDTYYFGRGSGQDTVLDFGIIGSPRGDGQDSPRAENTLRFGSGIKPEDLEITVTKGYEGRGAIEFPNLIPRIETDGDTWHIRLKGTNDSITLLNQTNGYSTISFFEFDNQTLTSYEMSQLFGFGYTKTGVVMADNQAYTIFDKVMLSADDELEITEISGGRLINIFTSYYLNERNEVVDETAEPRTFSRGDLIDNTVLFVPDKGVNEAKLEYWQYDTYSYDTTRHNQIIEFTVNPAGGDYATYTNDMGTVYIANNPNGSVFGSSTGADTFYGYVGNDVYRFGFDSGRDYLADKSGNNSLHFGAGVTTDNITVEAVRNSGGTYDWKIQIIDTEDVLTIHNQFGTQGVPAVSEFVFADGSRLSSDGFGKLFDLFPAGAAMNVAAAGSLSDGLLESSEEQALENGLAAWAAGDNTVGQVAAGMAQTAAYASSPTTFYTEDTIPNSAVI